MILADAGIWQQAVSAGITLVVLGFIFAVALLIASEKLKVQTDERVEKIFASLPGANCGACGFAGCPGYAEAVVADPVLLGRCFPGGPNVLAKIAQILNLQISDNGAPKRPLVHCRGQNNDKSLYALYQGIPTCISANALANVQACRFGCLGFGDCTRACKFNALNIVDGLAMVDYEKCTGCAACSKACPRNLIKMVPFTQENMMVVACSSREDGKTTRSMCKVGCIGCGLCVKQTDIFAIADNLAAVDYSRYQPGPQAQTAMTKCPTGVIVYCGKNAPAPRQPAVKA